MVLRSVVTLFFVVPSKHQRLRRRYTAMLIAKFVQSIRWPDIDRRFDNGHCNRRAALSNHEHCHNQNEHLSFTICRKNLRSSVQREPCALCCGGRRGNPIFARRSLVKPPHSPCCKGPSGNPTTARSLAARDRAALQPRRCALAARDRSDRRQFNPLQGTEWQRTLRGNTESPAASDHAAIQRALRGGGRSLAARNSSVPMQGTVRQSSPARSLAAREPARPLLQGTDNPTPAQSLVRRDRAD